MDQTTFSGAGTAVTAANPEQQTSPSGGEFQPQGGVPPVVETTQGAPVTAASPPESNAGQGQSAQASAYSEDDIRRWQQAERERNQIVQELQTLAAQQQRQQEDQRYQSEVQARLQTAYQTAENMEPTQAIEYIRRAEEHERALLAGRIRETEQQYEQRMMQTLAQVTAPLYAQELAKQNGLPPEYAERLAALNPYQMDHYVPVLKREYEQTKAVQDQLKTVLARLEQYERNNQAEQLADSGVHTPGGTGASPAATGNGNANLDRGSREYLLSKPGVAQLFGLRPAS